MSMNLVKKYYITYTYTLKEDVDLTLVPLITQHNISNILFRIESIIEDVMIKMVVIHCHKTWR
jgi:hypothetical protein